jgi:hypothetical protein
MQDRRGDFTRFGCRFNSRERQNEEFSSSCSLRWIEHGRNDPEGVPCFGWALRTAVVTRRGEGGSTMPASRCRHDSDFLCCRVPLYAFTVIVSTVGAWLAPVLSGGHSNIPRSPARLTFGGRFQFAPGRSAFSTSASLVHCSDSRGLLSLRP